MSISQKDNIKVSDKLTLRLAEYDKAVATFKQIQPELPIHLVEIKPNEKVPHGSDSWKNRTFSFEYGRELIAKRQYNIAIVADIHSVCFMDIDLTDGKFSIPEDVVNELVEKYDTFTVMTKSGGLQLYFINDGLTKHFLDNGFAGNPKLMYQGKDSGEIRTYNQYVLFPGSFVPRDYDKKGYTKSSTGMYTIVRNVPLKKLNSKNLPKWFVIEQDKKKVYARERSKIKSNIDVNKISTLRVTEKLINDVGLTLEEVRAKDKELDDLLRGADHIGDRKSRSEADFRACIRLDYWRFDDNQRASIMQRYRPYEKMFRLDYLLQTVDKARSNEKYKHDFTKILEMPLTEIKKVEHAVLPMFLPEMEYILIKAPPRLGKTHRAMEWMAANGNGVYCTNRHEIIHHAIQIFRKYIPAGKTAVYLAGKDKCCNRDGGIDCQHCPKAPHKFVAAGDEETLSTGKLLTIAMDILEKEKIITPDLLMGNKKICPYFTLMLAETVADYCFTIPFFLMTKDHIRGVKRQRSLLIIDEDPVCATFYPQGYELMSYAYVGKKSFHCTNEIETKMKVLDGIDKLISEKKRKPWWDKELMRMISILRKFNDDINVVIDHPSSEQFEELQVTFSEMDISNKYTLEERNVIRTKLAEYEKNIEGGHDINIYDIFAPLIHIAKMPFVWIGNRPKTLQFVANRDVLYVPEDCYKKKVFIGATESEMFIRDACGKDYEKKSTVVEINDFKYSKNFVLIKLLADKKNVETKMMYSLINKVAQTNAENDKIGDPVVPFLILESSKMKQESLQKHLKSKCIVSTNDSEMDQFFNWETGKANIFYSNSTLSRGLDIPFYDVIFADSLNFSVPYWTAMREYWKREGNTDKVFECNAIITKIISDEVTNSVLRCSPTMDSEFDPINHPGIMSTKEMDAKIIVIRESDVSKILPSVRAQMRERLIAFAADGTETEMNVKLDSVNREIRDIAKKTSRRFNLESRDKSRNLQLLPYCVYLLREFEKNSKSKMVVSGISVTELDVYFQKKNLCDSNLEALSVVDSQIRDRILQDPNLTRKWKRSEKSLIAKLVSESSKVLTITKKKVLVALEAMTRAGLLRSEFDGVTRYYRLPDKTLYGDPPETIGKKGKGLNNSSA